MSDSNAAPLTFGWKEWIDLEGVEKVTGKGIVGQIYDEIETRVRPRPTKRKKASTS